MDIAVTGTIDILAVFSARLIRAGNMLSAAAGLPMIGAHPAPKEGRGEPRRKYANCGSRSSQDTCPPCAQERARRAAPDIC